MKQTRYRGACHQRPSVVLTLQESELALKKAVRENAWNQPTRVQPRLCCDLGVLFKASEDLFRAGPEKSNWNAHQCENNYRSLHVHTEHMVLFRAIGLSTESFQSTSHSKLTHNKAKS